MSNESALNYPDILGYITPIERFNVGVVQTALTVSPAVAKAGHPFQVILLIQNAADAPVDVTVVLSLPEKDAKNQRARFMAKVTRLMIGLQPAEVGYVMLPVATLPDTASSLQYKLGMEITAKALDKTQRIRHTQGSGKVNTKTLRPALLDALTELRKLKFSAHKRGGLLRSTALEAEFGIEPGKAGRVSDLKPGWTSLWTMLDYQADPTELLRKYHTELREQVIPNVKRVKLYPLLLEKTKARFQQAGYALTEVEAGLVARLMTLITEYAQPGPELYGTQGLPEPTRYEIEAPLKELRVGGDFNIDLPHWANGMLRAIAQDQRSAQFPAKALAHFGYDDLLRDAVMYGFLLVEQTSQQDLGTDDDMAEYADELFARLAKRGELDFSYVYLPLIIGGVCMYEHVLMAGEHKDIVIQQIAGLLPNRREERTADNDPVFQLAKQVIDVATRKYGFETDI